MYRLELINPAEKDLEDLRGSTWERIREAILGLSSDPHPHGYIKLKGDEGFRIKVGDYRVIYDIDDRAQIVTILRVKHRKDVYRTL